MSNNNAKALKSGTWYIVSNFLVSGMALITTPVFARLLTHEQYGDYSNFHSWLSIATIVITMRMEASLISAKFDYKDRLQEYNRSMIALMTVVTVVWALVLNLFRDFFTAQMNIGLLYIDLILLYSFFHEIINIFQMNERYQYRYKRSVAVALLVAVSTTMASILLVLMMKDRLLGRVIGSILPVAVIGLFLTIGFFRRKRSIDISAWPYTLRISIPYVPHLLSMSVLNSVDRIMITRICGSADNALYTIAYSCGHMVSILMTAMNSAYAPWLGDKLHDGEENEIRRTSKYYMIVFTTLALGMMLLAPEILLIMGGKGYQEAKYVMPPVAAGCVCQFLYTQYVNVEQFKKKTTGMAVASVFAALLNYGLNAFLIPRYGYVAAAYTTLAGYLFLFASHMFLVKKLGLCDDSGIPHLVLEVGGDCAVTGRMLDAIKEGVAKGLRKLPGRPMGIMGDDSHRIDQSGGLNPDPVGVEPAPILLRRCKDNVIRLHVLMFGGGPAIRAKTYRVFHKHNTQVVLDEIVSWAKEGVAQLGCSPCTLAVGVGRSHFEATSMMLQAQVDGRYDEQSEMEREITRRVNEASIGPLGLRGDTSVIATFMKVGPQRASGVRIVCVRPACCFEPRIATVELQ